MRSPTGSVRRLPSGRWQARIQTQGIRERHTADTETEAHVWLSLRLAHGPAATAPTVAQAIAAHARGRAWSSGTRERYRRGLSYLPADFLAREVGAVTSLDCEAALAAVRDRSTPLGPVAQVTLNLATQHLRAAFASQVRAGTLAVSPMTTVRPPRSARPEDLDRAEPVALNPAQVHHLADAWPRYRAMVLLMASAGLRWGEAAAIRVDVPPDSPAHSTADLGALLIHPRRTLHQRDRTEGPLKTPASRRPVPITETMAATLRAHITEWSDGVWLFPQPLGGPLEYSTWRKGFTRVVQAAAASGPWPAAKVTAHTLRHTAGSLALAAGATLPEVSRLLRHSDTAITARVYSHALDDAPTRLRAAMALLDLDAE